MRRRRLLCGCSLGTYYLLTCSQAILLSHSSVALSVSMHEVVSLSSPSGSSKDSVEYVTHSSRSHAQYSASPSLSRSSHDSDDSLRALELSDGPIKLSTMGTRARSFSMGGFNFEQDLLPLSTSLSDPVASGSGAHGERSINLVSGMCTIIHYHNRLSQRLPTFKGIALIIGLQVSY